MGGVETFRRNRATLRISLEGQDGPLEPVEPPRALMGCSVRHPAIELFDFGFRALCNLNAESHTCAAVDRRPVARV